MQGVQARPVAYRFRLEFGPGKGAPTHEVPLAPADFGRAVEATFFDGLRRGLFAAYDPPLDRARLEPCFARPGGGSPRAHGFEVVLPTPDGGEHRRTFDLRFFRGLVRRVGAQLAVSGKLAGDAVLLYHLSAYLDGAEQAAAPGLAIEVESAAPAVPVRPGS